MYCSRFSEILPDFLEGSLLPDEQAAAEAHLKICSACRRLSEIAGGGVDLLPENRSEELTSSILDRTSGPVCPRVEAQLPDFTRGALDKDDSRLIALHLEHCSDCKSVSASLAVLNEELPAISEIEPDGSFTRDVVRATASRRIPDRHGIRKRLQAWWNLLVQRPLFSYEAAYVGTLALMLSLSPFLPFRELALKKMPAEVIQPSASCLLSILAETKAPVSTQFYRLASAVDWNDGPFPESLNRLVKSCRRASASVLCRCVDSVGGWSRELIQNSRFEIE